MEFLASHDRRSVAIFPQIDKIGVLCRLILHTHIFAKGTYEGDVVSRSRLAVLLSCPRELLLRANLLQARVSGLLFRCLHKKVVVQGDMARSFQRLPPTLHLR